MADPTLTDRIALAVCVAVLPGSKPCKAPCNACRVNSAAVAHEIANWLRERHGGSSTTADLPDGVGCHQPDAAPSIQGGWKTLERTQDLRMWPAIDPDKEAMALAIGRELRRHDV
jgi:alkylation response protein AidB-like acyl-CoA dehydrogenase